VSFTKPSISNYNASFEAGIRATSNNPITKSRLSNLIFRQINISVLSGGSISSAPRLIFTSGINHSLNHNPN
jgi:hypothetical protein